jgi:hypothetical protein
VWWRLSTPLRHDALAAERAGVLVDDGAIAAIVDVECDAIEFLTADLYRKRNGETLTEIAKSYNVRHMTISRLEKR